MTPEQPLPPSPLPSISQREYERHTERWWAGREVVLLRDLTIRSGETARKGRVLYITRKYDGFDVRAKHGSFWARRIHPSYFALLENA